MKDFAKSIYVGNAKDKNGKELRIGDIVLVWTSAGERAGKVKAISGERITVEIRNEGDWSTPGKLADKVSNKKTGNADVVKDGGKWVVLYAEGTKSKEFNSEAEAKKFAAQVGNSKVGNGLSDSYEFLMSAGKNDYNSIKEEVKKAGGWTPEIKAKARKTSDTLKKKAKELVETAHKQAAELERLAGDIDSI